MTISYNWLSEYLPIPVEPERLSRILTSIGLEVERFEKYEEIKGGLKGLIIGEILTTEKHPNADKLTLTTVNTGNGEPLQIVCGAPNVAAGQKVIVARVGTTIYPTTGEPLTMKVAKIRGIESHGMICAEDEIGLGSSHEGIMVLPGDIRAGMAATEYFNPYKDYVYEIGLTPNRMDAMSHWGVARDVCAWLSHHDKQSCKPKLPGVNGFKVDNNNLKIEVIVENTEACPRYSGVSVTNITIKESPQWLQQRLKSIGQRPINNIVDITNFIQHETGQPLHAFDAGKIRGNKIVVKNLPEGSKFVTLDEKERKLSAEDLMICDQPGGKTGAEEGICIAGVFGGLHSGITESTKDIFLESAFFNGITLRKTSFRHGLRTDAASRFEKGTDISSTVNVLKRAAVMIKEICGGEIASDIVDIYPKPKQKTQVTLKYHYLKKLSGKNYHPDSVKKILSSLGFEIIKEGMDDLMIEVPSHKPDVSLPADIVEEILRIDGLDNVPIPESITITPSVEENYLPEILKEKTANYLVGLGFYEIMTNSITNASYFTDDEKQNMVKMLNSLSADLNILRQSLFETSLAVVAHNLNHRNTSLKLFEFGKGYATTGTGKYQELEQLCVVVSGAIHQQSWKGKEISADFYYLKGLVNGILELLGINIDSIEVMPVAKLDNHIVIKSGGRIIAGAGQAGKAILEKFDIKQPVYYAAFNWVDLLELASGKATVIKELPKYPSVQRDLALVVSRELPYAEVEKTVQKIRLENLREINLFDIFESEKWGDGKKSIAVSLTFLNEEKTLTDKDIDSWMNTIMTTLEKELNAEIRK
jgi:phenylalanyl-tRNA synthetase beta chain